MRNEVIRELYLVLNCIKKRRYGDRVQAILAGHRWGLSVYKCSNCNWWHLTKKGRKKTA